MQNSNESHASMVTIVCPNCQRERPVRDLEHGAAVLCPCGQNQELPLPKTVRSKHHVTLFLRADPPCPLCDDAKRVIERTPRSMLSRTTVEVIMIDDSPMLLNSFKNHIPVVFVDGIFRFRGRVIPHVLRALLSRPPV